MTADITAVSYTHLDVYKRQGEKRAKNLFLRFRTLKAMEAATLEQLEETPGMTHLTACNLYRYLHEKTNEACGEETEN